MCEKMVCPNGIFKINQLENNERVSIIDITGKTVKTFINVQNEQELNVNQLTKGLYLVLIKNKNQSIVTRKIIIN